MEGALDRAGLAWWLAPALAMSLVLVAYGGSLDGGWVWDDHLLLQHNPALDAPWRLLTEDLFGPAGVPGNDYRPLVMLSFLPGHLLGLGAPFERALALLLHLLGVALVARLAQALGARNDAAWLGAAVVGVHPGLSEVVLWPSARQDLLPGLLMVGAALLWTRRRPWLAGLLLALTPFCKEPYLLAPLVLAVWSLGSRRLHPALLVPSLASAAYLALRAALDLPLPLGAARVALLGAVGASARRALGLGLGELPPDPLPIFHAAPLVGALALGAGVALLVASWGRPRVAVVTGPLLLVVPGAIAAAQSGLLGDRYLYPGFLAMGVAIALLASMLNDLRLRASLWLMPLAFAGITAAWAPAWGSDLRLFSAALDHDPGNDHAAFHLAHALHVYQGDCAAAAPLYARSLDVDPRAATNLQACLVQLGQPAQALALTERAAAAAPSNPNPAANGARAALATGDLSAATRWATEAVRRDPQDADNRVLLGNILGQQGQLSPARAQFEVALALDPAHAGAAAGIAACERREAQLRAP